MFPPASRLNASRGRACAAVLALLFGAASAGAAELRVPSEFASIQEAIAAAAPRDTILVAPGAYAENLDFLGKEVHVLAEAGPDATSIDGGGLGPVARFASGETPFSRLEGFTLWNGTVGVHVVDASPTVRANVIAENQGPGCLLEGGRAIVELGWIGDNGDTGVVLDGASALVRDNTIEGNAGNSGGGVRIVGATSARIERNHIVRNRAGTGGGVDLVEAGRPTLRNNWIVENESTLGGGIRSRGATDALIVGNWIAGNLSTSGGGGVAWLVPDFVRGPLLVANTIAGNTADFGSGVLGDGADQDVELVNNIVVAGPGEAAIQCGSRTPIARFNLVYAPGGVAWADCIDPTGSDGNISTDPLFADPANGDYGLTPDSPAVDVGDDLAPGLGDTDIDGQERILDGDGDGTARIDLGSDELAPVSLALEPLLAFLSPGEEHTVEAIVAEPSGEPVAGARVAFEVVSGPNAGATGSCLPSDCRSDADGFVAFRYRSAGAVGVDAIAASVAGGAAPAEPALVFWDGDCDANAVPDSCDLSCAGDCEHFDACGTGQDADGDGTLDACNRPPTADAGPDQLAECRSDAGTPVPLDGTGSSDPDGDPLSYLWRGPDFSVSGPTPAPLFSTGETHVWLQVDDGRGGGDTDTLAVRVVDTRAPTALAAFESTGAGVVVRARCSDACDAAPVVTATLDGQPVQDGELVDGHSSGWGGLGSWWQDAPAGGWDWLFSCGDHVADAGWSGFGTWWNEFVPALLEWLGSWRDRDPAGGSPAPGVDVALQVVCEDASGNTSSASATHTPGDLPPDPRDADDDDGHHDDDDGHHHDDDDDGGHEMEDGH